MSFSEQAANAITFTVPDRDGDSNPETIRYAWSGAPGDPLTRQYNGGTVATLVDDVHVFQHDLPAPAPNLLSNPGMESGVINWSAIPGATMQSQSSPVYAGSGTLYAWRNTNNDESGARQDVTSQLANGATYEISAWMQKWAAPAPFDVKLLLRVNSTGGGDPNWRTTYTNGVEATPQSLHTNAKGTLSWILEDIDGSLTDADTDLRLKGVGRVDDTVQVTSVKIEEKFTQADYLRTVAHAADWLATAGTVNVSGGPVSSNISFDLSDNTDAANTDAEAPAMTGDPLLLNGTFSVTAAKSMPLSTVFDDLYKPLSTSIFYTSLPLQGGFRQMDGTLSPTSNPWGFTDAEGIYYIYVPSGGKLKFKNFTLTGTLLIEVADGADLNSTTIDAMHPHSPTYATLVVKVTGSGVAIDLGGPAGGSSSGLIHLIGTGSTLYLGQNFNHTGTIVSDGALAVGKRNKTVTLTHDPNLHANPPLGYATSDGGIVKAVPGTWIWDAAPLP